MGKYKNRKKEESFYSIGVKVKSNYLDTSSDCAAYEHEITSHDIDITSEGLCVVMTVFINTNNNFLVFIGIFPPENVKFLLRLEIMKVYQKYIILFK